MELIVVLAIMAILAVLTVPSIKGTLDSINLKGAANMTVGQLELARQTAITRNVQVEFRVYADPTTLDGVANAYRIIAIVVPASFTGAASDQYISPAIGLPPDTVFDQSSAYTYSTLLDPSKLDASSVTRQATGSSSDPLQLQNRVYMKITFLPNGTLNLADTSATAGTWCLTLRNLHAKAVTTPNPAPAANYISMVLDPATSRARVYQP